MTYDVHIKRRKTDQFTYKLLPSMNAVRAEIRSCEGDHVQQVCYSTFMDTLTQICFTEQVIRSTVEWEDGRSWTP